MTDSEREYVALQSRIIRALGRYLPPPPTDYAEDTPQVAVDPLNGSDKRFAHHPVESPQPCSLEPKTSGEPMPWWKPLTRVLASLADAVLLYEPSLMAASTSAHTLQFETPLGHIRCLTVEFSLDDPALLVISTPDDADDVGSIQVEIFNGDQLVAVLDYSVQDMRDRVSKTFALRPPRKAISLRVRSDA